MSTRSSLLLLSKFYALLVLCMHEVHSSILLLVIQAPCFSQRSLFSSKNSTVAFFCLKLKKKTTNIIFDADLHHAKIFCIHKANSMFLSMKKNRIGKLKKIDSLSTVDWLTLSTFLLHSNFCCCGWTVHLRLSTCVILGTSRKEHYTWVCFQVS